MTSPKTLERALSKAGVGSRTQARSWIHAGRVKVNGRVVENPDHWIDFERDKIFFDDKPLRAKERLYILLYKPAGYLTTFKDPEGRPTVYDLIADVDTFLSPVGRLDLDTSGLLILTNDTQFAERLTNPDHKVAKTYLVKCADPIPDDVLSKSYMTAGIFGKGTDYAAPGPLTPIPITPQAAHLDPQGNWVMPRPTVCQLPGCPGFGSNYRDSTGNYTFQPWWAPNRPNQT